MTLPDIKKEIQKYQYFDDTSVIDFSVATVIANRLKLTDPVWAVVIGASSGGKSQILRPIAEANKDFIKRVDDLTENTLLSGAKSKEGNTSLLKNKDGSNWAQGMLAISDLTVLMSKSGESRATILSQFRMLFDGEMTKYSGNLTEPLKWSGYLGVIAGSTPSIYATFEEVADMGERFIYYRMKEFDAKKATHLALNRDIFGKELDGLLADLYREYIEEVVKSHVDVHVELDESVVQRIIQVATFAETVRTASHKEWNGDIDRLPVPAYPMRVALQLTAIAKALAIMRHADTGSYELGERELAIIDWTGYSLANEEKRACLHILAEQDFEHAVTTSTIADRVGLKSEIIQTILQNLSAVGVVVRGGGGGMDSMSWSFKNKDDYAVVRRIESVTVTDNIESRDATVEEDVEF
jgi:hypothetical protein